MSPLLYVSGGGAQTVTGLEFQPDMVWVKIRGTIQEPSITDSVRGVNSQLRPANPAAQSTYTDCLTSFNSDGFSLGADATNHSYNYYSGSAVAWNWKANGSGVSNTDGTITSTVSANTTAGFSIVTYTGNATAGATVGHGLGTVPSMVILKSRTVATNWYVWHQNLTQPDYQIYLNLTSAQDNTGITAFNDKAPTSAVFELPGTGYGSNNASATYVAYCFAEVEGFSKMGSYIGNGSTDGPFVFCGFRPSFIMWKVSSGTTGHWEIVDTAREPYNQCDQVLFASSASAESSASSSYYQDILSNGFKIRNTDTSQNGNTYTYIYIAFAENPFKNSLAR